MTDDTVATVLLPFEGASELRQAHASLLDAMDRRLGQDSRPESEMAALRELESRVRGFLERGVATGAFVENIGERTACQVLLDYWSSTLSHAGITLDRPRLEPFDAARLPDLKDRPCPFVGLDAFRDRTFFFGREKAVDSLLGRVAEVPLVVVQGASGSGKSSLVIGGVLPVLGAPAHVPPHRIIGPFTPGNAPLESLVRAVAAALPGVPLDVAAEVVALRADPGRLVPMLNNVGATVALLVVDQFEEVFTLGGETDRNALVAALNALLQARSDARVILTLREEFSNELDTLEPLRPYLARHARFSMKEWSMGYDDLKAAVERPAALVNLQFAPGIVDEMVKSVLGRDTALPLLQFALQSLWKQRDRNRITREVYVKIGSSPLAALERFADGFFLGLPHESQEEVKRILLDLVRIDRMLEPYRQPRLRSELLADGNPRTPDILELLVREDFVRITATAGGRDAAVEVKHEALLRNWPRYIDWINGKREHVRQRIALSEAAQRWFEGGSSATEGLLTAWQLEEVAHLPDLSALETKYVRASKEAVDRERIAHDEAVRRQERRKLIVGFAFVAFSVFAAWAWYAGRQSERRSVLRHMVDVQIQIAHARDASERGNIDNALTGTLRALEGTLSLKGESYAGALSAQAREMLFSNLRHVADLRRLFVKDGARFQTVAFHPARDEVLMAFAGASGRTYVAGLNAPIAQDLDSCGAALTTTVAFDPTGHWLAAGCSDGTLSIWSTRDWRRVGEANKPVFDRRIWTIAISPNGRLVAAGGDRNQVALVAVAEDGTPKAQPPTIAGGDLPVGSIWSLAFAPVGGTLLVGDGAGAVLECKAARSDSWNCVKTKAYPGNPEDAIRALAYSADGKQVAVGHWTGGVEVWDAAFSPKSRLQVDVGRSLGPVHSLVFFDACSRRQLAIGKGVELQYRPVDEAPQGAEALADCAASRSASVGDETYGIAIHAQSGQLAAATLGGYVAVVDPKGGPDPMRRVMVPKGTTQDSMRGAIVAEEGSTAWLAVPISIPGASGANIALAQVRNGRVDEGDNFVLLRAGNGNILRLAASRQVKQMATLACLAPAASSDCNAREIVVLRLTDGHTNFASVLALDKRDFRGLVPVRIALSLDGKRLVVSFEQSPQLLVVAIDGGSRTWIDAGMQSVREIAFSHDGKIFGAGGAATHPEPHAGADQVRLWNVHATGFEPRPLLLVLSKTANKVRELAFASDGQGRAIVLAGGESGAIDRWDVESGRMFRTLRGDWRPINLMAFSPDAALFATADSQNVVRLWDTSSWIALRLTPATDRVERPGFLAFGGKGTWLAGGAGTLQLWDVDVTSLQRKVCALLREPGQHGADSPKPLWRRDSTCVAP